MRKPFVQFKLNEKDVAREIKRLSKLSTDINKRLGRLIAKTVQRIPPDTTLAAGFPFQTGFLRGSYDADATKAYSGLTGSAFSVAEYAPYVEYGTGIYAVNGDGRKTPWSYKNAKGKWVTTVGQKPNPRFEPAIEKNENAFYVELNNIIKETIERQPTLKKNLGPIIKPYSQT